MRSIAFAVPALLLLAACDADPGGAPEVERPRLSLAGALPPADATVRIVLRADGGIRVGDRAVDAAGLRAELSKRAAAAPRDEAFPWKPSRLNVLLAADRRARVGDLVRVLGELTAPDVRMNRLFFEVERDDAGAFACFLPHDTCIGGGHGDDPPHVRPTFEVTLGRQDVGLDVEGILGALSPDRMRVVRLVTPESATVETLLAAAAACRRAGAEVAVLSLPGGPGLRPTLGFSAMRLDAPALLADELDTLRRARETVFAGFPVSFACRPEEPVLGER